MLNRKRNERSNSSHETSLIARGTVIRGDLRFSGALHLDGRIEGTVFAEGEDAMLTLSESGQVQGEIRVPQHQVTIGSSGQIEGEIRANAIVVEGQVRGNLNAAQQVLVRASGSVHGDIRAPRVALDQGCRFKGSIDMDANTIDLKGALVPAYALNSILGNIPIIGEFLQGGKGEGLFSATYSISGDLNEPKIDVNGWSALAPGFIRNLFEGEDTGPLVEPKSNRTNK